MKTISTLLLALFLCSFPVHAQYAQEGHEFDANSLILPASLLAGGTILHCFAHDGVDRAVDDYFTDLREEWGPSSFDDLTQYLPGLAYMGLGLLGAECEDDFLDRMVEGGIAIFCMNGVCRIMKMVIDSPRPNASDSKSFPSGHTAMAFTGAELVRMEYGWGWGSAAYALASFTAVMRLYNHEHWLSDVVMGAGVGILCAQIGNWLAEPCKEWLGINKRASLNPSVDPVSGALCATFAMNF